ncbi:MAG: flagellar biosynthesis protein FlhF [Deltaproteobacteria bacterium]|jgi:flagellar biosynthesis protein FlhF|nr:flagellar biosynthesis protein FlhF [Deltaproteobacteria bacterium]
MQIKTFSAQSTTAVMARIREDFGPDAVILETREENGLISMVAARERAKAEAPQDLGAARSSGAPAFTQSLSARQGGSEAPFPQGWPRWHEEWQHIRTHILALLKPALKLEDLPPRQRLALEFLQREGADDQAVLELFSRLKARPEASILAPLGEIVQTRPWGMSAWPQAVQIIAGPFGAGKTSVTIRLALLLRKESPDLRICLLNADARRGSGRLLLRHYAELSEMAYREATTTQELTACLKAAKKEGYERIFVDLPGLSRRKFLKDLLADAGLEATLDDAAVHLVLSPHYAEEVLRDLLERYSVGQPGSLVWTKLDETEHFGQMINAALKTNLPASALSHGPGLGNSLLPAQDTAIWRLLFKKELP